MRKHAHQPEPSFGPDSEDRRRAGAADRAREERDAVLRERGRAFDAGLHVESGKGIPFGPAERAIVHRLAAENPGDSLRMLAGRFLAQTHRSIPPQTVRMILSGPPADPAVASSGPPIPALPTEPPVADVYAAMQEIDAILKWLPPADRARVRAWFAADEANANRGSNA